MEDQDCYSERKSLSSVTLQINTKNIKYKVSESLVLLCMDREQFLY